MTNPAYPPLGSTYIGSIAYRLANTTENIHFVMKSCLQAKGPEEILQYPFLVWVDDVGQSSVLSMMFETGEATLTGSKSSQGSYNIIIKDAPLHSKFNVLYVDLLGVGLSAVVKDRSSISTNINSTALQI
jgi:hypothetical protein